MTPLGDIDSRCFVQYVDALGGDDSDGQSQASDEEMPCVEIQTSAALALTVSRFSQ